jgi:lysozyme family protein
MKGNFDLCLAMLLSHEGGFVNHKSDPGGMTNLGVTRQTWEMHVGHSVEEADMRALKPHMVAPLYKKSYWDKVKGDALPSGVDYAVFDIAVNSGVSRAGRILQQALGLIDDGIIGPNTLAATNGKNTQDLIKKICDIRLTFMQRLPTWPTFGRGWAKRVAEVQADALLMAD